MRSFPVLLVVVLLFVWSSIHPQADFTEEARHVHIKPGGAPSIRLADGWDLKTTNRRSLAQAKAVVSGDFDSDGYPDLITSNEAGTLTTFRGSGQRVSLAESANSGLEPFHELPTESSLGMSPDFLEAGDFNADGDLDILAATRGGTSLILVTGDGKGGFAPANAIPVGGMITALGTGEIGRQDGQTDVAVAVANSTGAYILIYEHPEGAFSHPPDTFSLPNEASTISIGNFDSDAFGDVAVVGGNQLTLVQGRGQTYPWDTMPDTGLARPAPLQTSRGLPFRVEAMAAGKFSEREGDALALLASDGTIYALSCNDTHSAKARGSSGRRWKSLPAAMPAGDSGAAILPVAVAVGGSRKAAVMREREEETREEVTPLATQPSGDGQPGSTLRNGLSRQLFMRSIRPRATNLQQWALRRIATDASMLNSSAGGGQIKMITARVSGGTSDDLVLFGEAAAQLHLAALDETGGGITEVDVDGGPIAAVPVRLNSDALTDLIVLRRGGSTPSVLMTQPVNAFTVTSDAGAGGDCGPGSTTCTLRAAISASNSSAGPNLIQFNIPGAGVHVIAPQTHLPAITQPVTIDGTTQSGYTGSPLIEITGASITEAAADGLQVRTSGASIIGLAVNSFTGTLNSDGSQTGGNGIDIDNLVGGIGHNNNLVQACFLGTDASGSVDKGNSSTGLLIFASDSNHIGGPAAGQGNVISGNGNPQRRGVGVDVTAGNGNTFEGNIIGLNAAGTARLGNSRGVYFSGKNNLFGTDAPGGGNTVSGNGEPVSGSPTACTGIGMELVVLYDQVTNELLSLNNTLKGNRFGTNPAGNQELGNCEMGLLTSPVTQTTIGSITQSGRNVFSGNMVDAIYCSDRIYYTPAFTGGGCNIVGNNIGTDLSGQAAIPNTEKNYQYSDYGYYTVMIDDDTGLSTVGSPGGTTPGGACTGFCNLISGNADPRGFAYSVDTLVRYGQGTAGFYNNFIGTNVAGTQALPNGRSGARGALNGTFRVGGAGLDQGGSPVSLGNLVSGNGGIGILVSQIYSRRTTTPMAFVQGNRVGTDTTGTLAIPNLIGIEAGTTMSDQLTIGGAAALERNIVSGNILHGIAFADDEYYPQQGAKTRILNNAIGTTVDMQPLGNGSDGIRMRYYFNPGDSRSKTRQHDVVIGGGTAQEGNVIGFNGGDGIGFYNEYVGSIFYYPHGHTIRNNSIHDNGGLGIDLYTSHRAVPGGTEEIIGRGVTPNDCGDGDEGPNALQNFPILSIPVTNNDGTTTISGVLKTEPSKHYLIDLYSNPTPDPTGHGEGQNPLGTVEVDTNSDGFAYFHFTGQGDLGSAGVSSTATDPSGNTSEFSCDAGRTCSDSTGNPFHTIEEYLASPENVAATACSGALIVNVTGDESDANADDGVCDIDTAANGLQCSLRAALEVTQKANYVGPHTIYFDIPGGGVHVIQPTTALPEIVSPVTIDATSQPGFSRRPLIELNGASAPTANTGTFGFSVKASNTTIRGFYVNRFRGGIAISGSTVTGVKVDTCYLGTDDAHYPNPVDPAMNFGVLVTGSTQNTIGGLDDEAAFNYLIGNYGGVILSADANANKVAGDSFTKNYIGVIVDRSKYNEVGGSQITSDTFYPNLFLNNDYAGIWLGGTPPTRRGLGTGLKKLGASDDQIASFQRSSQAMLDRFSASAGGYPGATSDASSISLPLVAATIGNKVIRNMIGTNANNLIDGGNASGIILQAAEQNTIGGTERSAINVVSGNLFAGIALFTEAKGNFIGWNRVGVSLAGDRAIPNDNGILVQGDNNTLVFNRVSGNRKMGISIAPANSADPLPHDNTLNNNRVGAKPGSESASLGNGLDGIYIQGINNSIGLPIAGTGPNQVCGNGRHGIFLDSRSNGNLVQNNRIGTDTAGNYALPNVKVGILIFGANNTIGGAAENTGNLVSGNGLGIAIARSVSPASGDAERNIIAGNKVGTNLVGTSAVPNREGGIGLLNGAATNTIGGTAPGSGNLISGNDKAGIFIGTRPDVPGDIAPNNNLVQGNRIGTDLSGVRAIPNGRSGIFIYNSPSNVIGGYAADIPGARNILSGNAYSGVQIGGSGATGNRVAGNYIGTDISGTGAIGNGLGGVYIWGGAGNNLIGGPEPNAGNLVANNEGAGVYVRADAAPGNLIDPNAIFGNTQLGIQLDGSHTVYTDNGSEASAPASGIPLPNDPGDADTGPNNLQNFPEFASAVINGAGQLVLRYRVDSAPGNSNYGNSGIYVEVFKADASLEGKTFLGAGYYTAADYASGSPGVATLTIDNARALGVTTGDRLVASASDASGSTSEFTSTNVGTVTSGPTAAHVSISGRVTTAVGAALRNAVLDLEAQDGRHVKVVSNAFGFYSFNDVESGMSYVLTVSRRGYRFTDPSRLLVVTDQLTGEDFSAEP